MRTLRALGEIGLIARLRRRLHRAASVAVGIGDDAAVLRPADHRLWRDPANGGGRRGRAAPGGRWLLMASDMVIEGVHFRRRDVPPQWIGWKALACNVSDIAAMGGLPHWAVVSVGLPPNTPVSFIERMYTGLERCACQFGMSIVGGDTVRAPQVVVDVAILGTVECGRLVRRSGARVGDVLFVTGRLGGSLRSGRHARFIPRLREAQALIRRVRVHAMIDVSDGLASDLWQLSRASRVALRVEAIRIPIARAARTVRHALMDGEDFELLFAVGARDAARVPRRLAGCPVTRIGTVIGRGVGVQLEHPSGRISRLVPEGFRHF